MIPRCGRTGRTYWQNQHAREVDYDSAHYFDGYEPAYRAGCEGFGKHSARAPGTS